MHKAILHDHLDGGLRASTAKELAIKDKYLPLIDVDDIDFVENKDDFKSILSKIDSKIKKIG